MDHVLEHRLPVQGALAASRIEARLQRLASPVRRGSWARAENRQRDLRAGCGDNSCRCWPDLTWDSGHLAALLGQVSREQGRLLGRMQDLGLDLRLETQLSTLTEDVVRSSEIEGEKLDTDQIRSSLARRLGMDIGWLVPADRMSRISSR